MWIERRSASSSIPRAMCRSTAISSTVGDAPQISTFRPDADNVRHDGYHLIDEADDARLVPAAHAQPRQDAVRRGDLPDRRTEMLSCARFNFGWALVYNYADDAAPLVPAGTLLHMIRGHDNSAGNKGNPDPKNWAGNGNRTIDEMASPGSVGTASPTRNTPSSSRAARSKRNHRPEHSSCRSNLPLVLSLSKDEPRARGSTSPVLSELALRQAQGERVEGSPRAGFTASIWGRRCGGSVGVRSAARRGAIISDLREGRCTSPPARLPALSSSRRHRADAARQLRRRASVGESDPPEGRRARDAAVVRRSPCRSPGVQERSVADRRRDRDGRAMGGRRGAARRRGRSASAARVCRCGPVDDWRARSGRDGAARRPGRDIGRRIVERHHGRCGNCRRIDIFGPWKRCPGEGSHGTVHHVLTYVVSPDGAEESFLNGYVSGVSADVFPDHAGRLLPAGSKIRFNVHLSQSADGNSRSVVSAAPRTQVSSARRRAAASADHRPGRRADRGAGYPRRSGQRAARRLLQA